MKPPTNANKITPQPNKIHLGYSLKGSFVVWDAYNLEVEHQEIPKAYIWNKIWKENLRLEIFFSLWPLVQKTTLTWYNIKKCNHLETYFSLYVFSISKV